MKYAIALGLIAASVAGCGSNSPTGYHDPKVLSQSVREELQKTLDDPVKLGKMGMSGTYIEINSIDCLPETKNKFSCIANYTEDNILQNETWKIIVSKDGNEWIKADS